jgi:hypothetical protein
MESGDSLYFRIQNGIGYCLILKKRISFVSDSNHLFVVMDEIHRAMENKLYYVAISTVLTLPDICVSLISKDGRSDGVRYAKWCNENLKGHFTHITGQDLYSMRCGVIHNGRFGDLKNSVARFIIVLPFRGNFINSVVVNDAYIYNADAFVINFISCVKVWYLQNQFDRNVESNIDRLVQYRPYGLSPYIFGTTVLA